MAEKISAAKAAKPKSKFQGMRRTRSDGEKTDPVYFIVNPKGALHECSKEHARWRLGLVGWRLATDEEVETYLAAKAGRGLGPIAAPWTPEPPPEIDVPAEQA